MKKKLKIFAYILFGLSVFLASLFLTFPFNSLIPPISDFLERETGQKITVKSLEPTLFSGLVVKEISIKNKKNESLYHFDSASISIPIFSLLNLSPVINSVFYEKGAVLAASFHQADKETIGVSLFLKAPSLNSILKKQDMIKMDGNLSAEGEIQIPIKNLTKGDFDINLIKTGDLSLNIEKGKMIIPAIPISALSNIPFNNIKGKVSIAKGSLLIETLEMDGNIQGSLNGSIMVRTPLNKSRLDIKTRFKPTKVLLLKLGPFISILNNKRDKEGYYNVNIRGTVAAPRPVI